MITLKIILSIIDDDIFDNNNGDDYNDKDLGWDMLELRRRQFKELHEGKPSI